MRLRWVAAGAILLAAPACAHRVDEYLQAALLSVEKDRVGVEIRMTPGIAVFPAVLGAIDTDADGRISEIEQRTYAEKVLRDLSLTVDGDALQLRLDSVRFDGTEEMKEGLGAIQLAAHAGFPGGGPNRKLVFRNRHQSRIAAYLVNSLVSRDPDIRPVKQNRSEDQSIFELDYVQGGAGAAGFSWGDRFWTGAAALVLLARLIWLWRGRRMRAAGL